MAESSTLRRKIYSYLIDDNNENKEATSRKTCIINHLDKKTKLM